MTYALIDRGRIVAIAPDGATMPALGAWLAGRPGRLALLGLGPGETACVGDRVDVVAASLDVATRRRDL